MKKIVLILFGLAVILCANDAKTLENNCKNGAAFACNNLGLLYYNGEGVKQDYQTANEFYTKACDLGNQDGCDNYKKLNEKEI